MITENIRALTSNMSTLQYNIINSSVLSTHLSDRDTEALPQLASSSPLVQTQSNPTITVTRHRARRKGDDGRPLFAAAGRTYIPAVATTRDFR